MKVVLPGGSGQLGTLLARAFSAEGHDVVVLSRSPSPAPWRTRAWDASSVGAWATELEDADVVINLAGRSVDCRYTPANRRQIMDSRVHATRAVGQAIQQAARPPRHWLQMSTATIYSHRYDAPNHEHSGVIGGSEPDAPETWRFSIDVARSWEQAFDGADTPGTRKVAMRAAMVMSPDRGGVFAVLSRLVRFGLGGRAGDGRQYVSWIHDQDFVAAVRWLIAHEELTGAVNVASPEPLPNAQFMRALREAWGVPFGLPALPWMVELGAVAMRTESELVLKSRRVVPARLLDSGFVFAHPGWPDASRDLVRRWRSLSSRAPGLS
jgi:uncharacterized protein (TIGR01777 family)